MGFKVEQFVKSVDENLFCSICLEVFQDPVSCKDGHTFCTPCIHDWLKKYSKCPLNGEGYLFKEKLVPQLTVKGIIDNLEVYCDPQGGSCDFMTRNQIRRFCSQAVDFEEICDWIGKLQNLTQHRKTCPFQVVKCSNENCSQTIQRSVLELHEKICDFRHVECEQCGMELLQHEKENHMKNDCMESMILCPNECHDKQRNVKEMKRAYLNDHVKYACPKAVLSCPFRDQGCSVQVERQYVDVHVQDAMAEHMMLLAKQCSSLTQENLSLSFANDILSKRCSQLDKKSSELHDVCLSLFEMVDHLREEISQVKENCSYTWTINDFPSLAVKHCNGSAFTSPIFWLCGHRLCFLVYPNGLNGEAQGWLSLYLNFSEEYPKSRKILSKIPGVNNITSVEYRLTVKSTRSGADDFSCELTHVFAEPGNWGWLMFLKTSEALSEVYCNSDNSLTITIQSTKAATVPDKVATDALGTESKSESETNSETVWESDVADSVSE